MRLLGNLKMRRKVESANEQGVFISQQDVVSEKGSGLSGRVLPVSP